MDAVFRNDLVLEIILTFAIKGKTKKICPKNLCSFRLVQKLWLKTVSRILQKVVSECPYEIELDEENSLTKSISVQVNGKLLDQFISTFTANNHLQISIIPGFISLGVHFFQAENYDSLFKYFSQCGQHLKVLKIDFPLDGGSMPVSFPQFSLPSLQDIIFEFTDTNSKTSRSKGEGKKVFGDNRNGLAFLQLILNASSKLKTLQLYYSNPTCVPGHFEYIKLPNTLTDMLFECELTTKLRKFMLRQNLPILEYVQLHHEYSVAGKNAVFKVLERFRKTLKSISFVGTDIRFPVMDSLEELRFPYSAIETDDSGFSILPEFLPKLKKVVIGAHIQYWSNKFSQFGLFTTVKRLDVRIVMGNEAKYLNYQVMERFHKAFPNLEWLSIGVTMENMTGIDYLVGHMNKLKILEIYILGKVAGNVTKRLETILLGPSKIVSRPRLLNLSELHTLSLHSRYKLEDGENSLLTSSIFQLGLQQMKNLRKLNLCGKFKPTTEMEEMWGDQETTMKYIEEGMVC